jgi:hypothetical protein
MFSWFGSVTNLGFGAVLALAGTAKRLATATMANGVNREVMRRISP